MQSRITVDARAAGLGKTTDSITGIYARVALLVSQNERVLIVTASVDLSEQYQRDLSSRYNIAATLVNHTTTKSIEKGDDVNQSVTNQLNQVIVNQANRVVCITASMYKLLKIVQNDWHLIIDECVKPITASDITWTNDRFTPTLPVDLAQVFIKAEEKGDYTRLLLEKDSLDNPVVAAFLSGEFMAKKSSKESRSTKKTKSTDEGKPKNSIIPTDNYDIWVNSEEYDQFKKEGGRLTFIHTLKQTLIDDWKSVHIAAAAFQHCLTALWLKFHNIPCKIIHNFIKHIRRVRVHTTTEKMSKNKYVGDKDAKARVEGFIKYTEAITVNRYIALYNSGVPVKGQRGEEVAHNCHGLNHLKSLNTVLLLSSINLTPSYRDFLNAITGDSLTARIATEAYDHYQVVMRSSLRDQQSSAPVSIVVPCKESAMMLSDTFFSNVTIKEINHDVYKKTQLTIDDHEKLILSEIGAEYVDIPGYEGNYQINAYGEMRRKLKAGGWKPMTFVSYDRQVKLINKNKESYAPKKITIFYDVFGDLLQELQGKLK